MHVGRVEPDQRVAAPLRARLRLCLDLVDGPFRRLRLRLGLGLGRPGENEQRNEGNGADEHADLPDGLFGPALSSSGSVAPCQAAPG